MKLTQDELFSIFKNEHFLKVYVVKILDFTDYVESHLQNKNETGSIIYCFYLNTSLLSWSYKQNLNTFGFEVKLKEKDQE